MRLVVGAGVGVWVPENKLEVMVGGRNLLKTGGGYKLEKGVN